MKMKSEISILQTDNVQKQILKSTDLKVKMNKVFVDHSKWLREMKDQVIFQAIPSLIC